MPLKAEDNSGFKGKFFEVSQLDGDESCRRLPPSPHMGEVQVPTWWRITLKPVKPTPNPILTDGGHKEKEGHRAHPSQWRSQSRKWAMCELALKGVDAQAQPQRAPCPFSGVDQPKDGDLEVVHAQNGHLKSGRHKPPRPT